MSTLDRPLDDRFGPDPAPSGITVGRVWLPASRCRSGVGGPTPVAIRDGGLFDLTPVAPTMADLLERPDVLRLAADPRAPRVGDLAEVVGRPRPGEGTSDAIWWLSPIDLQVIKACGVTFAVSAIERVIEERAGGQAGRAEALRERLVAAIGRDLSAVRPGSEAAVTLKARLVEDGLWSQYLEVAIGPDAEVFTKAPVLASIGTRDRIGVRRASAWNNSEPEAVLVIDATGRIVGATLGNDMNLRDFEGRSALLLGEAKDANASCALGPWIRLFDPGAGFTIDALLASTVDLHITGADGTDIRGSNRLAEISRDPRELVRQVIGETHQYPDGVALFLGTMFVPTADRGEPGAGFTHHPGDVVSIANPYLGRLVNEVAITETIEPWTYGIRALWTNIDARRSP
jgi:fumarylacetoacetate (FAA) hydrolase family protein